MNMNMNDYKDLKKIIINYVDDYHIKKKYDSVMSCIESINICYNQYNRDILSILRNRPSYVKTYCDIYNLHLHFAKLLLKDISDINQIKIMIQHIAGLKGYLSQESKNFGKLHKITKKPIRQLMKNFNINKYNISIGNLIKIRHKKFFR